MEFRKVAVIAVALLMILSGCSAFGGSQTDGPANDTNDTDEPTEPVSDDQNESTNDSNSSDNTEPSDGDDENEDDTANAEWSPPQEPNRPLERKDLNGEAIDRIESVEFVDKVPAEDGQGYSNFNLEVTANTSMPNIDPPSHGTVRGEPYFFVKINQGPDDRKLIERTSQVPQRENGRYHIDVRPAGIEEFGEDDLNVEVFLVDRDKDWDDVLDATTQSIHFNPDSGGETGTDEPEVDDDSDTNETESTEGNESETSET
ncbi:hypothetical protein [Natrinema halophilum]|uniref:Uncharacterized protein n=1 Tax=Natrinema halophilum TaxID=1699371 RepID=A0A7D5GHX8_9EURY|nr:hypothetical protein [Natrinema halophilum]QLG49494.1 hypothetical protein HYG82_11785 [Natrinema halophilum]